MLTDEQIAELDAKYGEVAILRGPAKEYEVVFRRPTRAEYRMFRANINNPAKVSDAQEMLAMACVVHPTRDEYLKLLETYYAIPDTQAFSTAMQRLMKLGAEESTK
jgi:preprotein translocase subunit Sss1